MPASANASRIRFAGGPCDPSQSLSPATKAACDSTLNDAASHVDNVQNLRAAGWVVAGAGAATFVTGVVLVLTAPDPHKYDEEPVGRLFADWRIAPNVGIGSASVVASRPF